MISLIIKCYLTIFISIGSFAVFVFLLGLYFILRPKARPPKENKKAILTESMMEKSVSEKDLEAIAGDDMIATQLDLARAYLETGQISSAKKILEIVIKQGNDNQRNEALNMVSNANCIRY